MWQLCVATETTMTLLLRNPGRDLCHLELSWPHLRVCWHKLISFLFFISMNFFLSRCYNSGERLCRRQAVQFGFSQDDIDRCKFWRYFKHCKRLWNRRKTTSCSADSDNKTFGKWCPTYRIRRSFELITKTCTSLSPMRGRSGGVQKHQKKMRNILVWGHPDWHCHC